MAGRPKKQIESTQEEVVNEVVNVEVAEVTKDIAQEKIDIQKFKMKSAFNNIPGVGCVYYSYFFYDNVPVNMETTFLPNVKAEFDEDKNVIFSHINA